MASDWEHFPHGADIGVRGFGETPAKAFERAALAMTAVVTDPALVAPRESVTVEAMAPTLDILLVDFLNALVFEMAERGMLFSVFAATIDGGRLTATARGESVSRERHAPGVEIKGATFTELAVVEDAPGRWRAQCVVDV
ncbi:archease [Methylosinus sp. Ce-a6]|uniref:archease n=1 Tax=Methylosinus sp. Ce-a6 TaxID=2172005 RepID=UPI00135A58F2|nr:archease [Methylosinus sp. Ce-a6]